MWSVIALQISPADLFDDSWFEQSLYIFGILNNFALCQFGVGDKTFLQ